MVVLLVVVTADARGVLVGRPRGAVAPAAVTPQWTFVSPDQAAPVSRPVRIRIPAIDVDSSLVDLAVDGARVLQPPERFDVAGWFAGGTRPGDVGPALIAAHVDSKAGPAVFFRLVDLRAGDEILVDRADGTTARFTVHRTGHFAKPTFPTEQVYAPTPEPELRLVTCGGTFDYQVRSYRDNVIVEAVLA